MMALFNDPSFQEGRGSLKGEECIVSRPLLSQPPKNTNRQTDI
jgi:hypothetical protein